MKNFFKTYKSTIILLAAIIVGAIIGIVFGEKAAVLSPLGDIFLNLLFVAIIPLIFVSITVSISKMKQPKRLSKILTSIIFVFMAISSILLVSCNRNNMELYKANISEARYNYYYAEAQGYLVSFTSGIRESDFKLDGYHTENIEFGVITIILPKDIEYSGVATYRIEYDNKLASGTLEQNPYQQNLPMHGQLLSCHNQGDPTKLNLIISCCQPCDEPSRFRQEVLFDRQLRQLCLGALNRQVDVSFYCAFI